MRETTRRRSPHPSPGTHKVYRLRDSAGRLLYVGITWNVDQRVAEHRRRSLWWPAVETVDVEEFDSREAAETAERVSIAAERPSMNVFHGAERAELREAGFAFRDVAVREDVWIAGLRTAQARGESFNEVIGTAIGEYVARHRALLDPASEDE